MAAPALKSLYKRELLVAPKPAFAIAGCAELHTFIAERVRDKIKLTGSVPSVPEFPQLLGLSEEDPLATSPRASSTQAKKYLRGDLFSYYQRVKPGVCLALIPISSLTSGATPWRECMKSLTRLNEACLVPHTIRLVVAVVSPSSSSSVTIEEFSSVACRDLGLDSRHVLQLDTSPTDLQVKALEEALMAQANKAYKQWQKDTYHRCQALSAQEGALTHLIRQSIKAAHFCELTHSWSTSRSKYGEAYKQLQHAMAAARSAVDPQEVRMLCMAADWVHLKMLLYAIGSGNIGQDNVKNLHSQWRAHLRSFGAPLPEAHASLQSWHYEWLQRQNHALLAVMRMYCQTLPRTLLTPELKSHMLLDGAAAAAAARQALSPRVRSADLGVVLDTSTVADGPWLGSLMQTNGSQPRVLSAAETLAYLAWQERSVEHPAVMIALLEDCIQEIPRMIAADASDAADAAEGDGDAGAGSDSGSLRRRRDSHRRRSLSLIAQKGSQMMRAAQERKGTPAAAWLEEAWALLAAAAVQFRREGWYALLASTLEHGRTCAQLRGFTTAAFICALELSVVGRHLPPTFRLSLAREALSAFTSNSAVPVGGTGGTADSDTPGLHYKVQWTNMSSGTEEETGGSSVMHHGWLNVMNLSVACVETGVATGDVVLAVALRNMLPQATALGADAAELDLPVKCVHITAAADLGFTTLQAHRLDRERGWRTCLGAGGAGDGKGGPGETIRGSGSWRRTSNTEDDLPQVTLAAKKAAGDALRAGEWKIYAARLRADDATHVQMHAVQVSLSSAASVTFMVGQLSDSAPGGAAEGVAAPGGMEATGLPDAPPHIICGAPALGLQNGLVGRDAPFTTEPVPALPAVSAPGEETLPAASAALDDPAAAAESAPPPLHLRAGMYGVALRQRLPPASLVASRLPNVLRVAECAAAELRVTPQRTVSAGTPLWLRVRRDAPGAGGPQEVPLDGDAPTDDVAAVCRVFVGHDAESAVEVVGSLEVPLPALAVGAPCVMTAWIVGVGPGKVVVEGGVLWLGAEAGQEPAVRSVLQITEPFGLQATFTAVGGRVVGMLDAQESERSTTAGRVAAASRCGMALRLSSAVPFPLSLSALALTDLAPGWAVTSSSCDSLEGSPQEMCSGDVYAAHFTLCTPVATGASSIGALHFCCRRVPDDSTAPSEAGEGEGGGAASPAAVAGPPPEAVREIMHEERTIVHPLPQISVCSRMVEAWFEAPPQVAVGASSLIVLKLVSCMEEQLSIRVGLATGGSERVLGDAFRDVWLRAGQAGEVEWEVCAEEAGVLDLFGSVEVLVGRPSGELDAPSGLETGAADQGLEFALSASVFVRA
eukprot:jgi/Ulvmu1/5998/UM026_0122.1